jgi:hypothetical protein
MDAGVSFFPPVESTWDSVGAVWSLADFGALRVERDRITAGAVAFKRGSPTSGNLPKCLLEAL